MRAFRRAMDALSDTAFKAYRDLVYGAEGFTTFFREMTPIAEIAGLKIGSRPASRKKSAAIEDLRAIPWVFSWSQARVMLPGWYGVGQAIAAFDDKKLLAEMAEGWPLFAATLANMEQVLAKSNMGIAEHYAGLVADAGLRDAIFGRIRDGWRKTHDGLLGITGQSRLLEKHPGLETSIRLRLPYIEPLNLLQIELMKRHRAGEDRRAHRRGHPAIDQRHRHGAAQFGLIPPPPIGQCRGCQAAVKGAAAKRLAWTMMARAVAHRMAAAPRPMRIGR